MSVRRKPMAWTDEPLISAEEVASVLSHDDGSTKPRAASDGSPASEAYSLRRPRAMDPACATSPVELAVEVRLGTETVPLKRLLRLEPGGVLPLSRDPEGPIKLVVNGAVVATGELVVVDGKFGFRVIEVSGRDLDDPARETEPSADTTFQSLSLSGARTLRLSLLDYLR